MSGALSRFSRVASAQATAVIVALGLLVSTGVSAAELVIFEAKGCPYCAAWDREVGHLYDLTQEARRLPLRRVDISDPRPADLVRVSDIRYTPTFVVMVDGKEIGRIVGYSGEDHFWGLLGEIVAALPHTVN